MIGILVHGDNHFIVEGPKPDPATAAALAREWSLIRIGASMPLALARWRIINKAFRENLEWAVIAPAETEPTQAVMILLNELAARGIPSTNGVD